VLDEVRARLEGVTSDDLRDLADLRKAISGAAAALAAERAAPGEIDHLRVHLERMSRAGDLEAFRRGDGRLHIEIAAVSRSARLTQAEIGLQSELRDLLALLPDRPGILRLANREHRALVQALEDRDAARARQLAEQHVDSTNDLVIGLGLSALER
jgi:DNA-binding FadR family transcriptional regulator